MTDELYQFIACDYFATGEGRSIMLLITRAYPHVDDYETHASFDNGVYTPGILKKGITDKVIALREFIDNFGEYFAIGAENLSREEFLNRFGHLLPEYAHQLLNADDIPGNFNFSQKFHINFS